MRRLFLAALVAALLSAVPAHATQVWHRASASTYGGPCESGETIGYRGDYLPTHPYSFAELGMGSALGGLPYGTHIRVLNLATHHRLNVVKRDIGLGGVPFFGVPRGIDMYYLATQALDPGASCSSWSAVLYWRRL